MKIILLNDTEDDWDYDSHTQGGHGTHVIGSLSLKGGLVDDISFKNHKQNLENNKNIEFLNPPESENGFYIETGWTSINNKIKVPTKNTIWSTKSNNTLNESLISKSSNHEPPIPLIFISAICDASCLL